MPTRSLIGFLRSYFARFLEFQFNRGRLTQAKYFRLREQLSGDSLLEFRDRLVQRPGADVPMEGLSGAFRLVHLREPDLSEFPFLLYVPYRPPPRPRPTRQLTCFVGHRFYPKIEQSLRFNPTTFCCPSGSVSIGLE